MCFLSVSFMCYVIRASSVHSLSNTGFQCSGQCCLAGDLEIAHPHGAAAFHGVTARSLSHMSVLESDNHKQIKERAIILLLPIEIWKNKEIRFTVLTK